MNAELDRLRKEMTREEFIEDSSCPHIYGLEEKCRKNNELGICTSGECDECTREAVKDIQFKDDIEQTMEQNTDKAFMHGMICSELTDTYKAKNKDYGDSFAKLRREYGNPAILIRLEDKLGRLKRLMLSGEQAVKTESIEDTLKDLANYAIMELVEREIEKEGEKA